MKKELDGTARVERGRKYAIFKGYRFLIGVETNEARGEKQDRKQTKGELNVEITARKRGGYEVPYRVSSRHGN